MGGTRDAVLVNGLATLAGCTSIVLAIVLRQNDEAFGPGLGVALSATGVLLVWSLTLAVRAWRRGERNGWVWAVMVLGGLETVLLGTMAFLIRFVLPFSSPFEWAYETGLIVFLPVGAIAYLAAVPVTWWRLRRAARRDANTGLPTRSHWKRGLIWFCAVAGLLTALLLPGPLFLYCSDWDRGSSGSDMDKEFLNWRIWVWENTPVFVADTAAGALAPSSHPVAWNLYVCALRTGRVSKNRLLAEVNSTDSKAQCALLGLERSDPQAALALADQIGQGSFSVTSTSLQGRAGWTMGRHGTPERIRYFFDQAATQSPPDVTFMSSLCDVLANRPEFLPEIASFAGKTPHIVRTHCRSSQRSRRPRTRQGFGLNSWQKAIPSAGNMPFWWFHISGTRTRGSRSSCPTLKAPILPYVMGCSCGFTTPPGSTAIARLATLP